RRLAKSSLRPKAGTAAKQARDPNPGRRSRRDISKGFRGKDHMTRQTRWRAVVSPMLLLALLFFNPLVLAQGVGAQDFAPGTIRIVGRSAPSTPPDIISRVVAQQLAADKDWNVVVENKPGAVMTIAGSEVLRQPADGTSIYAMSLPVSAAPAFLPDMPF